MDQSACPLHLKWEMLCIKMSSLSYTIVSFTVLGQKLGGIETFEIAKWLHIWNHRSLQKENQIFYLV